MKTSSNPSIQTPAHLTIAFIGVADMTERGICLYDPLLYYAFMLMSQNMDEVGSHLDESGFEVTDPLKFSFAPKPLIFRKYKAEIDIVHHIKTNLLPPSDGIIVSLSGKTANAQYLASADPLPSLLRQVVEIVLGSNRPTVFAIQHSSSKTQSTLGIPDTIPIISYGFTGLTETRKVLNALISEIGQS